MDRGEGERLHAARRRRFWATIGALGLIGAAGGYMWGYIQVQADAGGGPYSPEVATFGSIGILVLAILAAFGSWRFFVSVDEVEVADNLWGSLIGFYAYAILFPSWWAMAAIGAAPEPDDWLIFGTSMAVAVVAYFYRKWRFR